MGGIYVYSMENHFNREIRPFRDYAMMSQNYGCTQNDWDFMVDKLQSLPSVSSLIPVNGSPRIRYTNEISFRISQGVIVFTSTEDLAAMNQVTQLVSNITNLPQEGEIILSEGLAKNANIKVGDILTSGGTLFYFDTPLKVKYIYPSLDYSAYAVDSAAIPYSLIILRKGDASDTLGKDKLLGENALIQQFADDLETVDIPNVVYLTTFENQYADLKNQMPIYNMIFYSVVILVSIVLAITINATLIEAYGKRKSEFSIYHAIGIPRQKLVCKIIKEIALINLLGLTAGLILNLVILFVINQLIFYPRGLGLPYFSWNAAIATLLCDLSAIMPSTLLRIRNIKQYDITKY
jgi:ABC-type lipoprotein release transport system permease subunit